jgi:hypothetical protein
VDISDIAHAEWTSCQRISSTKLVRTIPPFADSGLQNAAEISGNVAVMVRGEVGFDEKVRRAVDAGAVGVLVINNNTEDPNEVIPMIGKDAPEGGFHIPAIMISHKTGEMIKDDSKCIYTGTYTFLEHAKTCVLWSHK